MTLYQYPSDVNFTTGFAGMFNYLNVITNSWFSNMLLVGIYIIFASGSYLSTNKDIYAGFAIGGFATFVMGLLLFVSGLISGVTFSVVIAVAIISFVSLWFGQQANLG